MIVELVFVDTAAVVTVKVAVVAPAGTETEPGTVAEGELDVIATGKPAGRSSR